MFLELTGGYSSRVENIEMVRRLKNGVLDYKFLMDVFNFSEKILEVADMYGKKEQLLNIARRKDILDLVIGERRRGLYEWHRIALASYLEESMNVLDDAIKRGTI